MEALVSWYEDGFIYGILPHLSVFMIGYDESRVWENPFTDVKQKAWYYDSVRYVHKNELMNGTSADKFSPNLTLTRGMVVTVLYRKEGIPEMSAFENPFSDVKAGKYYTDAVKWAAENGIVSGYGDGRFAPDENITREQMAVILRNYELYTDKIPEDILMDREFADWKKISGWAKDAVNRLVIQGIINGKPDNLFDPKGAATRAEFAAILYRFLAE
jgi:hypothetical protein